MFGYDYFRKIENTLQFLRGEEQKTTKALYTIFRRQDGRGWIKKDRRYLIREYLETTSDAKLGVAQKLGLTDDELRAANQLREFWGTDVEGGLFLKFGVEADDFLEDYVPRIREFEGTHKDKVHNNMHEFLTDVFGDTPPAELDAFFKHQRIADVVSVATEKDPLTLAIK
jgi:hypothetical protein